MSDNAKKAATGWMNAAALAAGFQLPDTPTPTDPVLESQPTVETLKQRLEEYGSLYSLPKAAYDAIAECERLQSLLQGVEQSILLIESMCKDDLAKRDLKRLREFMKDPTARAAKEDDDE